MALLSNLVWWLVYIPIFSLSVLKGLFFVAMTFIFKGRAFVFEKKTRDTRPECMNDPSLGTHKTVRVKGLNFHLVVSGDPKNPLMLFLHGFPECWYAWRHQIREFNKDYYCVAFDMRGVGETDAPLGLKNYVIDELTSDVSELVKVLGYTSCTVVGHDWGGAVAWCFVAQYPHLVERLINMNIGHPDRFYEVLTKGFAQVWMAWYMFFFQLPYLPEMLMSMGDYKGLEAMSKKGPSTAEDVEALKYSLGRPGRLTSFLNYYRANMRFPSPKGLAKIRCPTILIWGTADVALHTDNSFGLDKYCDDITVERIAGGDHFIQQEQPTVVNDIMRKFLSKQ